MKAIYLRGAGSAQVLILQAVPLEAFYAHKGLYTGKRQLVDNAIYLERELCKEAGSIQVQIAASFSGFNRINFSKDGIRSVRLSFRVN